MWPREHLHPPWSGRAPLPPAPELWAFWSTLTCVTGCQFRFGERGCLATSTAAAIDRHPLNNSAVWQLVEGTGEPAPRPVPQVDTEVTRG